MTATVTLTTEGSLRMPLAVAERYFPHGLLVPRRDGMLLLLYPTRGTAAGGLLLKQRTAAGERSVLLRDFVDDTIAPGSIPIAWDEVHGALRLILEPRR